MAESPAHKFGQIIGNVLEIALLPLLSRFAKKHGLYLDRAGARPCRKGTKCTWIDLNGNKHDLDFVMERGGSPKVVGTPVAFIETAWRRYTKHSRNKAQEIQGAIEPLAATFKNSGPFKGAVLAGVFTEGAIQQLRSLGFAVLFFPTESMLDAFRAVGIDATSTEKTSRLEFQRKVDAFYKLGAEQRLKISQRLLATHRKEVSEFLAKLERVVSRQIDRVIILALHGKVHEATTIDDAIKFVEGYADDGTDKPLDRYEMEIRYNNGDAVRGSFADRELAIQFLTGYLPPPLTVQ
jgi:hypothetical protein